MNLMAYDTIKLVDYNKTWVDPKYKKLYSRELPYYKLYSFAEKYNNNLKRIEYYLILHNDINAQIKIYPTIVKNNVTKIQLYHIWDKMFYFIPKEKINIELEIDDIQEDCIIYYINSYDI